MSKARSPFTRSIGLRIHERRMTLGLSRKELAQLIGVSPQQIQKYEHGVSAVSVGRLYEVARRLNDTPIEYFFEGLERKNVELSARQRRLLDLARSFEEIRNEKHLEAINLLTRALAGH